MKDRDSRFLLIYVIFFAFAAVFFTPKPAETQELRLWNDVGLYGGQITSIAVQPSDPQVMYAGSWGGDGLFKTTDGGANWTAIPQDAPSWFRNMEIYDIKIDPGDPLTIWVANNHYVDVSRDGGENWETFFFADDDGRFCYSVAVDPFDSQTVYVGTGGPNNTDEYGEIFFTRTGGELWDKQDFNISSFTWNSFWQVKFNPNRVGELWAANRKTYLSDDQGMVFVRVPEDNNPAQGTWWYWELALCDNELFSFGYIDEVLVHPANPDLIFLGSGEGIAYKPDGAADNSTWFWTEVYEDCRALCIPPAEPSTIYGGLADTIVISKDSGATWPDNQRQPAPSEFLTLEPHPSDPATLFAGSLNQGVYKTADRSETWSTLNTGIKANTVFDTAIDPSSSDRVLCATLAGVFLKDSAASDWKSIHSSGSEAVAFSPSAQGVLYAGFDWKLGKTTDNGTSWSYLYVDDQNNSNKITSIALDAAHAIVYAAVSFSSGKKGQLLKYDDTADPFASSAEPLVILETPEPLNAVAVSPHNPSFLIAVSGSFYSPVAPGKIYLSRNGGRTWRKRFLRGNYVFNCIAFDPAQPGIIYIGSGGSDGSDGAVLKSINGGLTWRRRTAGLPPSFAVKDLQVTAGGAAVYAALYKGYSPSRGNLGGTYVSLDGGMYWTRTGLSDYRMFDITLAQCETAADMPLKTAAAAGQIPAPTYTVYAGSASGLMNQDPSAIAGNGIVSGMVRTPDGQPISEAYLSTSAGTGAQSDRGVYMMLCPSGNITVQATAPGYIQTGGSAVTVEAGGSCELDIVMQPFGDNSTTCISQSMLQETPESRYLEPLRSFRDSVLKKTPLGQDIISRYYSLGAQVLPVLQSNARLAAACKKLLAGAAEAVIARQGKPLSLPPGFRDEAGAFLLELEKNSPLQLRAQLKKLRADMRHFSLDRLQATNKNPDFDR